MSAARAIKPAWQSLVRPLAVRPQNARFSTTCRAAAVPSRTSNNRQTPEPEDLSPPSPIPRTPSNPPENLSDEERRKLIAELNPGLELPGESGKLPLQPRLPRAVQALYLQPLRRDSPYGVPACDLQMRSYSIPNLEFFCDFALRAAYYLGLPAYGPVPLPKITERWTVPKSHFIFKKSQENFERITRRRLIQIRDGHPETVQIWLGFLQKHAYYGIGMKANVWEFCKLDVGKQMDEAIPSLKEVVDEKMDLHLSSANSLGTVEKVKEILQKKRFDHR